MKAFLLLFLVVVQASYIGDLYHTSEQIDAELEKLSQHCPVMTIQKHNGPKGEASLTSVSIKSDKFSGPKLKVLLFFGEHSRELISVESGLSLIKHLCGVGGKKINHALIDYSLQNAEFLIFTNIGVNSRRQVERGQYCTRVNENGVDLNRNWNDHWSANGQGDEYPGTAAFTEDETHILKQASEDFKSDLFLTVHSGTLGMYIPYAFSDNEVQGDTTAPMLRILNKMNPKFCNCDVGSAGKEVGYLCPGTCLDYIYDLGTKYSFAFEIYERGQYKRPPSGLAPTDGPGSCMLQKEAHTHSHSHHAHMHSHVGSPPSSHVRVSHRQPHSHASFDHHSHDDPVNTRKLLNTNDKRNIKKFKKKMQSLVSKESEFFPEPDGEQASFCFESFNPTTPEQYIGANLNWVSAYLTLVKEVNEFHVKSGL